MCSYSHYLIYQLKGQATVMKSTQVPSCGLSEAYNGEPPCESSDAPCRSCTTTQTLQQTLAAIHAHNSLPWYSHVSHSCTDSVRSHGTSQTYGSSPLTACTCLHTSLVGLQSLLSDLVTSIGHPANTCVPMQHGHLTLWSDTHHDWKVILAELRLQPALSI